MRLILATDDGATIDDVEDIQDYNLESSYVQTMLLEEIRRMMRTAHKLGAI